MSNIILTAANSGTSSNCIFTLKFPTVAMKNMEMSLHSAIIPYLFPNFSSAKNNNTFQYQIDGSNFTVTLPDPSCCTVDDINDILHAAMDVNKHYLLDASSDKLYFIELYADVTRDKIAATMYRIPTAATLAADYPGYTIPSGFIYPSSAQIPRLNIPSTNIVTTLGFTAGLTASGTATTTIYSNNIPKITGVDCITMQCNWIQSSSFSNLAFNLATIPINAIFGSQIVYEPTNPYWFTVNDSSYSNLTITICDQNGNPINDMLENNMIITVGLRSKQ